MSASAERGMEIIPVIDLKGGLVVRARMGRREQYRPIETPLSPTSVAEDVVQGLMSVLAFGSMYVADLDAIERIGDNDAVVARLKAAFPRLALWIDNGVAEADGAAALLDRAGHLVLGSEAQRDAVLVGSLRHDPRVILSLDFRGDSFIGPPALLDTPDLWPQRIIVMTLARVGSGAGPDIERLGQIRNRAGDRRIYAAGGVRNRGDLVALKQAGIAGALVASALHDGTLRDAELRNL